MIQIKHTSVSGFGLILVKHMGIFLQLSMGLLNHMCQINHTCVTFSTREWVSEYKVKVNEKRSEKLNKIPLLRETESMERKVWNKVL